jgi:hypothetical protein
MHLPQLRDMHEVVFENRGIDPDLPPILILMVAEIGEVGTFLQRNNVEA